jgi:hypothetical protein
MKGSVPGAIRSASHYENKNATVSTDFTDNNYWKSVQSAKSVAFLII